MERTVLSLEELTQEAEAFVRELQPHPTTATLVTLSGELGAGKTAFTKAVAKALGVKDEVTSPTFVLEKIYQLEGSAFTRLIHIDAYRLKGGIELGSLGFDELMNDPGNLVLLEWPEKVSDGLPQPAVALSITADPEGKRTFTYA